MDLPATCYGTLDKKNPVITGFKREINSFLTLMKRATSGRDPDNLSTARGIKILVEIWKKYKHRLPAKLYHEHILQIADFLCGKKLYQLALWYGYSLHLLQFSSVKITDITDVDHFMACFFPGGFDEDPDTVVMKGRAMLGSVICISELEKQPRILLSQEGLCQLLRVLNFIWIMLQAFQQHQHISQQIYEGLAHIYNICRHLMTMECSAQALKYLLWASISLETSPSLMTANCLPLIVTLYCAVCQCYYDNHAEGQAKHYAKRALEKIHELEQLEGKSEIPATRETQRAYREASVKLTIMISKQAVFETRPDQSKKTLRGITKVVRRPNETDRVLTDLFDCGAAKFLGILEALSDSTTRPLQTKIPDEAWRQEVVLQLLSAGLRILSGKTSTGTGRRSTDDQPYLSPATLTATSSLIDAAVTGENRIPILSAVRFIKLLLQYKQPGVFAEVAEEMLRILSGVEGQPFRKAERELALLCSFNNVMFCQGSDTGDVMKNDRCKSSVSMSDELTGLVDTLQKTVCGSFPDMQPDGAMVLDTVLFLWDQVQKALEMDRVQKPTFTHHLPKMATFDRWVWCLFVLCEVALFCEQAAVDHKTAAEMICTLGIMVEKGVENIHQTQKSAFKGDCDYLNSRLYPQVESSNTVEKVTLLKKVCELVKKALESLAKGVSTFLPHDCSAITDTAFMQKSTPPHQLNASATISAEGKETDENMNKKEESESEVESDFEGCQQTGSPRVFQLVKDLHLKLNITYHRASLKLLQLNAVAEPELLEQINKNKVSKALFLMQKALLEHNTASGDSSRTSSLLEEASTLIEKAEMEERKLYRTTTLPPRKNQTLKGKRESPPPPPILLSRTDHSFTFAPAPYDLDGQVCWYQLHGKVAEGINKKVRLIDCSLPGTGNMVPAVSGECVLRVDGLQPNQKYAFAAAAYNREGKLLGDAIGETTLPLLASMPAPLLSTWAHLAQVAFQTQQYAVAKRACKELWGHYVDQNCGSNSTQHRLATNGLHKQTIQHSSPYLCQLFLTSIFIETEINVRQGSLYSDSFSPRGPFIWEQEARLAECEQMLVAMDFAMCLNKGDFAVQAVITCYKLLEPIIFHQVVHDPVVQVLTKCLVVLEQNSAFLQQNWTESTSESLLHMIACITFYLSKALRAQRHHQLAAAMIDCGIKVLQKFYDAQLQISKPSNLDELMGAPAAGHVKISLRIEALHREKNALKVNSGRHSQSLGSEHGGEVFRKSTIHENAIKLYDQISSATLQDAYQAVRTHRKKSYFLESAKLLLQRTMEEGQPDLVLKWGRSMLAFLSRRDREIQYLEPYSKRKSDTLLVKTMNPQGYIRRMLKQRLPETLLKGVNTIRKLDIVENLLFMMPSVAVRLKKKLQLRNLCSKERLPRSHMNYVVAQAKLALLYQGLDLHYSYSYSHINPLDFSLASTGVLVRRTRHRQHSSEYNVVSEKRTSPAHLKDPNEDRDKKEVLSDDSAPEESCENEESTVARVLDFASTAALHFRRAMVLAHRGGHWKLLLQVCHTLWDQSQRITLIVNRAVQLETQAHLLAEQLLSILTKLLLLATDLIMDMLTKLELWHLYDQDLTEEELESSLHFSAALDDSTLVDPRWVRTLVLHTLEQLHNSGKWESLAHFALLFNSYTRERYALIIAPLLVHAQRRLLERISSSGGPGVPQPHHVKTQMATGLEVTNRSYAGCQLLSGWTCHSAQQRHKHKQTKHNKSFSRDAVSLKDAEMQRSMSLVCVPLDVEETLSCYRQAFEKRPYCLKLLQHSRSLLALLLANTQPCFATQVRQSQSQSRSLSRSASQVAVSPFVIPTPQVQPCDLSEKDFSSPNDIYSLPISPDYTRTVTAAYSNCIRYLKAGGHESLQVLALHEMGNLHFYTGNTREAHSCWSKAVDQTLQCSGVLEKWDGESFGESSSQITVKQAGIWGCFQAAVLSAKIALFILTSDIGQRTKCCLLSAHLFKCVLRCSMAQPQTDLGYATHTISGELLPGVDLFSEPTRLHLGTTVTSLNFISQWLYTTGYYITLLPVLALYLYFVGPVCRDVQRTVEGKILKVRALTELCLFTEALKEALQLTQATDVFLPHGVFKVKANQNPMKTFCSNKSLLDNLEVLEDLVNCDFTPEVRVLYGPTLCARFNLARVQLILTLTKSVHGPPEKEKLTPERVMSLLLGGALSLLRSVVQQLPSLPCSDVEILELKAEAKLLKANLCLQSGEAALSFKTARSSLVLLQTSDIFASGSRPEIEKGSKDSSVPHAVHGDCPGAVEASERMGASLWLRCRLSLVRSLVANIPGNAALLPGKNINRETIRVILVGVDECDQWGDRDSQALFMVEGAELEAQRGRMEESTALLQQAVGLLSDRTYMPPGSVLTLARATLLLIGLRGAQSTAVLQLTQKLLEKQLSVFGQNVTLVDGKICFSPPGPTNIYLPYLDILDKINNRITGKKVLKFPS
ncbi:cilia- and flagella-associated protein 54-like [Cololabis saira]|uniref:cilia- and flagella-associated protein 54-like n=1 Tax=Cololabis saira TaxID=129043 RepID=UPI002AD246A5|nr:cilia- and flagella-associated protein 54-like [Cololabis saira]